MKQQRTVLLVDDEPDILQLLEITLARMNLNTERAMTVSDAKQKLTSDIDLCLTDMQLPDGTGLELIKFAQAHYPTTPIAMITAHGNVETAIEALKLGAFDFVTKPLALEKLRELIGHALESGDIEQDVAELDLIGAAPATERLRNDIRKVARSQAPVHIYGESGVGKELVAKLVHRLGPRGKHPFIAVNCGAIPPELVESELFGHKKGSFTGATADKAGLFAAAAGGTLLLDEVADLPMPVQVKLLRVIQEKSVRPIGSETEVPTDVRLLSATHKKLNQEVREGRFRDDLYYRINVIGIEVPPLRERREDILPLAGHLLQQLGEEQGTKGISLSQDAESALLGHDYPGNIRELQNILARAAALTEGATIGAADMMFESLTHSAGEPEPFKPASAQSLQASEGAHLVDAANGDLEGYLDGIEKAILSESLTQHRWNKTAAAKALGISFRSLRYRLKKLGLED